MDNMITSKEIRAQFLDFFKNKGHRIVPSSPVIPYDDPTLLFTNAGMNQFKDVFLGTGRREYARAADTQKCIRVSGKHNDLDEVGHDTYHHTFFEMLGNWSFGDYYKAEAIEWGWELLTKVWKLPGERLWVTVFREDDEAFELWKTKTDIDPEHILRFDEKDNFWEMGEVGPCGPCSEIHINIGEDFNNPKHVNAGVPQCIEIWNLVFIQYNRDETGKLHELPAKHIDTGMGFERICAVLQKKDSNYDTDIFLPLITRISEISGIKYEKEEHRISMRVIADHTRALAFAIADGAVPGNEGRGYVLRRILRRAARYGRKLKLQKPFIYQLVDTLSEHAGGGFGEIFPELKDKSEFIKKVIKAEEENFNATLDRGIELFDQVVNGLVKQQRNVIPGVALFKLYDTFGFPLDLTNIMAQEKGLGIDEEGFDKLMEEQKQKGRESAKEKFGAVNAAAEGINTFEFKVRKDTVFTGYDELRSDAEIIGHKKENGNELVILNKTPFYVESGGQVDDTGKLLIEDQSFDVLDVTRLENNVIHLIELTTEEDDKGKIIIPGKKVFAEVDKKRRWDIMRNHSATHFLHSALRKILGVHVHQAGSYVGPDRLRFDFTHFAKVSDTEIKEIEELVNGELRENYELQHHRNIPFDQAKKMGALMFFGDKYGDKVNVVQFGEFTKEFCGGTHVINSSQIGLFKIVSETSIASGVRRIEAVTGPGIESFINKQAELLKNSEEKLNRLLEEKKKMEKEIADFKLKGKLGQLDSILTKAIIVNGIKIYKAKVAAENMDELKSFGDEIRNKTKGSVAVLFAELEGKVGIVSVVTDDLLQEKKLSAGTIVGELARIVGGGGGGRPHLATAGGKDTARIPLALNEVERIVASLLG